ncbi:MAG: TRAP transporter substrate-binding protein DctP [Deltaproteobacteria bacterium]|nr:TRAP transporter substrate-binding protein DctP [Deltaproteobacteria bacterium]
MKTASPENARLSIEALVGQRIRELRLTEGLTIKALAESMGISIGQLSRIENGKTGVSVQSLLPLCERLNRSLSYFFRREEEIPKVLGTLTTVEGPESQGIEWFAREVAHQTDGQINLVPLKAHQLGSGLDQVAQLASGHIDIFIEELYHYWKFVPGFGIFSLPYVFENSDHQQAFLKGRYFRETLLAPLGDHAIRMLTPCWNWHRGIERVLISSHPVVSPEDLAGKRIRIFEAPILDQFFRRMGAVPVTVPWTDVSEALQKGIVDVAATHKSHLFPLKFCSHARYVTRLGDISPVLGLGINENKFRVLPPTIQKVLCRVADTAGDRFSAGVVDAEVENEVKNIQTHGAVYLTVDLEPWKKAAKSILAEMVRDGLILRELVSEIALCR